jgi:beta-fructofuranosidase
MSDTPDANGGDFAAMRARLRGDRHRPRYHFAAPADWLNDPNGLIQWQGVYHLFYQYNPNGPVHGTIHWGHAASRDLLHWEDWPVALAPTPDSPDADGVYSGCAVDDNGVPTLVYSGNRRVPDSDPPRFEQRTCLATSADGLRTWTKEPRNPVIPDTPAGLDLIQYRDPSVWREGEMWYQVTGAGIAGVGGTALVYRSRDLHDWEYLHPLCVGDVHRTEPFWTGTMWECPQFFALDETHVLIISIWDRGTKNTTYLAGDYADHRLTPRTEELLDLGWSFYAPQSFRDGAGRRIMFGWLREERPREALLAAGWAGAMSLPRILTARPDGALAQTPAPELRTLRGAHVHMEGVAATAEPRDVTNGLDGSGMEIVAELEPGDAERFGLAVFRSPDGAEETRIVYDRARGELAIDRARSSIGSAPERTTVGGACPLDADGRLRLRVFLDGSIIEVFANDTACLTARAYPTRPDSTGVALFAEGGAATARSLDLWEMASVW